MGKIGEGTVSKSKRRIGFPKGALLYLDLKGGETVEFLTTTTDLKFEELADDCLILRVQRKEAEKKVPSTLGRTELLRFAEEAPIEDLEAIMQDLAQMLATKKKGS